MTKGQQQIEQFYSIVNRTNQLRSLPVCLEGCQPLNTAALHLIETIGTYECINMTEISAKLGLTKGAVSQMAAKLVAKGLIIKTKPPHSEKDVYLSLTSEGMNVFDAHNRLHKELYADLSVLLEDFTEQDLERISLFFRKVETYMDEYAHLFL